MSNMGDINWSTLKPGEDPLDTNPGKDGGEDTTPGNTNRTTTTPPPDASEERKKPALSEQTKELIRMWHRGFKLLLQSVTTEREIYTADSNAWIHTLRHCLEDKQLAEPSAFSGRSYFYESQKSFTKEHEDPLVEELVGDWAVIFRTLVRGAVLNHNNHWPKKEPAASEGDDSQAAAADEDGDKADEVKPKKAGSGNPTVTEEELATLRIVPPLTDTEDIALFEKLLAAFEPSFAELETTVAERKVLGQRDYYGSPVNSVWKTSSKFLVEVVMNQFQTFLGSFFPRMMYVLADESGERLGQLGHRPTQKDVNEWWDRFDEEKAASAAGDFWVAIESKWWSQFQKACGRLKSGKKANELVVVNEDGSVPPEKEESEVKPDEDPLAAPIAPLPAIDLWDHYDIQPHGWHNTMSGHQLSLLSFIPAKAWDTLWLWYGGGPRVEHKMIQQNGNLVGLVKKMPVVFKFEQPKNAGSSKHEFHVWGGVLPVEVVEKAIAEMSAEEDRTFWSELLKEDRINVVKDSYSSYDDEPLELKVPLQLSDYASSNTFICTRALGPGETKYPRGHCGLSNLGNTCYMNAALQCMINTAPLREQLLSLEPASEGQSLTTAFRKLMTKVFAGQVRSANTRELRDQIAEKFPRFANYEQHDSIELVNAVLDAMHEELNEVKKKSYRERLDSDVNIPLTDLQDIFWKDYLNNNKSLFAPIFHGQLKSRLECLNCGKARTVFDAFSCLPLAIDKLDKHTFDFDVVDIEEGTVHRARVKIPSDSPLSILREQIMKLPCIKEKGLNAEQVDILRKPQYSAYGNEYSLLSPKGECGVADDYQVQVVRARHQFTIAIPPATPPPAEEVPVVEEVKVQPEEAAVATEEEEAKAGGGEEKTPAPDAESSTGDDDKALAAEKTVKVEEPATAPSTPKPEEKPAAPVYPSFFRVSINLKDAASTTYSKLPGLEWLMYVPVETTRKEMLDLLLRKYLTQVLSPVESSPSSATSTPEPSTAAASPVGDKAEGAMMSEGEEPVTAETNDTAQKEKEERTEEEPLSEEDIAIAKLRKCLAFSVKETYGYMKTVEPTDAKLTERDLCKMDNAVTISLDIMFDKSSYVLKPLKNFEDRSLTTVEEIKKDAKSEATLAKCLDRESNSHRVDDQVYCSNCKNHEDAVQEQRVWVLPEVLVIQYKRFQFSPVTFAMKKLSTKVEFPVHLDMAPYVIEEATHPGGTQYHLAGVIHHSGSVSFGHYTATVWNTETQQWVDGDDSRATARNSPPDADLAYILFYQRVSSSSAPPPERDPESDSPSKKAKVETTGPNLGPLDDIDESPSVF